MLPSRTTKWSPDDAMPRADGLTIIGQLGQSLDGQIATATGHSKYINGPSGLTHLHALRAWADVVVVGVGTVVADDPRLTVRLTEGKDPDRVVIDPRGRVPAQSGCLQGHPGATPVRRVVLQAGAGHASAQRPAPGTAWPPGVQRVTLPSDADALNGHPYLSPQAIRAWLATQGWQRVLLEGGAATLAGFLHAGCLDYLHLITSPVLLGPGVSGVRARPLSDLAGAPRFQVKPYALGDDLLMVCAFG